MTTIHWVGDSTVKANAAVTWPQTGIGQEFHRFVNPRRVRVEVYAENGRSSRSFINEGRLVPVAEAILPGDFLFIQFGHNDEKAADPLRYTDPAEEFPAFLEAYVNVARMHGATPVIITPLARRCFARRDDDYRHTRWAQAARDAAARLCVPLVDLTAHSMALIDRVGAEEARRFYMHLPAGRFAAYPNGQTDDTHLQPEGAVAFGGLVARALIALGGECAALIDPDVAEWLQTDGESDLATDAIER